MYGFLWLTALARSFRLLPIVIGPQGLLLRIGLLWSVPIEPAQIVRISRLAPGTAIPRQAYLRLAPLGEPEFLIELSPPVFAEGPLGIRRQVKCIGLALDHPQGFEQALSDFHLA